MHFKNKFQLLTTSGNYSNLNNFFLYFFFLITQNKILNIKLSQTQLPMKIKKFTLLKSPHVYKTARTQLELRSWKKTVTLSNIKSKKQIIILEKIINNLIKNLPTAIRLQLKHCRLLFI